MLRNKVQSGNLEEAGWENNVLEVKFHPAPMDVGLKSGPIYRYSGVPRDVYDAMTLAPHPGVYFYANIRSRYGFTLVDPGQKVGI